MRRKCQVVSGRFFALWLMILGGTCSHTRALEPALVDGQFLPATTLLVLEEPLHQVQVRGIRIWAERQTAAFRKQRRAPWLPAADGSPATMSIDEARRRLRNMIGAVDALVDRPAYWRQPVHQVWKPLQLSRWEVLEGITGEAMSISNPAQDADRLLIILPDPDQPLKEALALAVAASHTGVHVEVPFLIDRQSTHSGHPEIRWTNLPHREFVYRAGYELGRHVIGYDVQKVRALARYWKQSHPQGLVLLYGIGEGGLIAMMASSCDGDLIDRVAVSGYFGPRDNVWQEPIYRNLWGQLREYGDAEIASLTSAREFIVDTGNAPEIDGPAEVEGRARVAAPGRIRTPQAAAVQAEFERLQGYLLRRGDGITAHLTPAGSSDSMSSLAILLRPSEHPAATLPIPAISAIPSEDMLAPLRKRQLDELLLHTQRLLHRSDKVRAQFWKQADRTQLAAWMKSSVEYRRHIHQEMIGQLPVSHSPLNPRTRKVIDEPTHIGYEVVLDVHPPQTASDESPSSAGADWGIIAGGILLLPRDLRPGERRPVVVCQHGLEGTPQDTITTNPADRAFAAYKGFSTQLVQRGYIVYAPQNPYKGYDDFRVLQRKSNPLGLSLFSYIIEQHRQTLKWLATLPWVDSERIAFYGLSYGGKTAVRVPPLLAVADPEDADAGHPVYCLSICSADFNEWIRKNVSIEDRYSYVFTPEYEMFEWNMGHIADYAELSTLMTPRPFMVERGHDDGVAPDEWVAWEYAKVRRHYDQLGLGDKTEIEWFNGPHTINGQGTFRFLDRHLNWQKP